MTTTTVVPLRELIAEHRPYVRASLRHLGVGPDQIDDAEQDLFLVLVRRKDDFDASRGTSYRGWMWGMCRNIASTYHRKSRRSRRHDTTLDTPVRPPMEERIAAKQVLSAMDESSRALWLGRCEGRSARELADSLSLPLTTVEWRLRRARHAVTTALRGLEHHAGAWIGWLLRPQQGLAALAVPALAVLVLAQPPADEPTQSQPRPLTHSIPEVQASLPHLAAALPAPDRHTRAQPPVGHVEDREPSVRTVEPSPKSLPRRKQASGRVALGDPQVVHP